MSYITDKRSSRSPLLFLIRLFRCHLEAVALTPLATGFSGVMGAARRRPALEARVAVWAWGFRIRSVNLSTLLA